MLDIEIYLDILGCIHATAGGEGVEVRILSGHSKGSELLVNAQIPHPLIAAGSAIHKARQSKALKKAMSCSSHIYRQCHLFLQESYFLTPI